MESPPKLFRIPRKNPNCTKYRRNIKSKVAERLTTCIRILRVPEYVCVRWAWATCEIIEKNRYTITQCDNVSAPMICAHAISAVIQNKLVNARLLGSVPNMCHFACIK